MAIVHWDGSMNTGFQDIDAQHAHLFTVINSMHEKMLKRHNRNAVIDALDSARNYVRYHFASEEKLLREHNYPDLEMHLAEHRVFANKIDRMAQILERAGEVAGEEAAEFLGYLMGWLATHIMSNDMKYSAFLKEHGAL